MTRNQLLTAMAVIEWGAGLALLLMPAMAAQWMFGEAMPELPMMALRLAGLVLFGLGTMCWAGRTSRRAAGAFRVMLGYNLLAAVTLALVGLAKGPVGSLLWPVVVLHAGLAVLQVLDMRGIGTSDR
jgi:uncharacterized protein YjeT (DUF2065 family)